MPHTHLQPGNGLSVKDLKGLNGATVCVAQGTTHEVTLGDYGRANNIDWKPLVFDRVGTKPNILLWAL